MIISKKSNVANDPLFLRIQNNINLDTVAEFEKVLISCYKIKQKILPVVIDSHGGCPYSLISLYEIIKKSKIKISTIVESRALSCAGVLFSCGHKGLRYMSQNSTIMIHDVKTTYSGKTEDAKADAKETERLNKLLYKILEENSNKNHGYFQKIMHKNGYADLYLTPQECLEFGIVDHIGIPTLRAKVSYRLYLN